MLEIIGLALSTIGTILIAFMALRVHHRVIKDHKIDEAVFKQMKTEQVIGVLGILLITFGYFIQLIDRI